MGYVGYILAAVCAHPPYWPNGTWCGYESAIASISNSTEPVSATVGTTFRVVPLTLPIFLGALYVWLWIRFGRSPGRYKTVGITALVFVVSVILAAGGLPASAVLNFVAFAMAWFIAHLFER